jgi:mono/diheme cytochrome c family protein
VRRPSPILACSLALLAVALPGCESGRKLAPDKQNASLRTGARLFHERCGGCHTINAADARGSKPEGTVAAGERTNGPNFNVRKENREDVLFAIRNGGYSGAIMPANIVTGQDAQDVALFLERYAGANSIQGAGGGVQNAAPNNK